MSKPHEELKAVSKDAFVSAADWVLQFYPTDEVDRDDIEKAFEAWWITGDPDNA